ncbi:BnaCnng50440D [Brassica napus]|uniref:BnaCnng50440D protein n=1 Tax=Brassica napus TaxID=3708 RepID=A0A078JKL7_BRANA|nr:BnaCnng50440D [Brassica napus]
MFPKWEFDVEDTPAENIIKLMFPTVVSPAKKKVVKEDSPDLGRKLVKRHLQKLVKRQLQRLLWRRRLVSPQNGKGHHLKTLPLHLNRRSNPG